MSKFKIQKNVPMPEAGKHQSSKYPFAEMEVGDSIFFDDVGAGNKARSSANAYGRLNKKVFSGRKHGDGYRIWRTK